MNCNQNSYFSNKFKVKQNQILYFFNVKQVHFLHISKKRGTFALLFAVYCIGI